MKYSTKVKNLFLPSRFRDEEGKRIILILYIVPILSGLIFLLLYRIIQHSDNLSMPLDLVTVIAAVLIISSFLIRFIPYDLIASFSLKKEKELSDSKESYRILFENANDAIFIMDGNKFIECNSKASEMLGCNKDKIIGETPLKFSPYLQPEGMSSEQKVLIKIKTAFEGIPQRFDWQYIRGLDQLFEAEISLARFDLNGKVFLQAIVRDITERKNFEAALKLSTQKLRSLFEFAADPILLLDFEGNFIDVNMAACDLIGYSKEQFKKLNILKLNLPEHQYKVKERFIKLAENNESIFETYLITRDGKKIPVEVNAKTIEYDQRKLVIAIHRDITKRKIIEEENLKNQLFVKRITEQSPDIIYIYDVIEDRNVYTNKDIGKMLGYIEGEIPNDNKFFERLMHPDDLKQFSRYYELIKEWEHEYVFEFEYRLKDKKGDWRWFVGKEKEFSRIENGEIISIIGTTREITEKKKTEEILIQSEEQFRSVWENSFDAMRLCNEDGIIIKVNEAFCTLFEMPKEKIEGFIFDITYLPDEHSREKFRENVKSRNVQQHYETKLDLWNNKIYWVEISNSFVEIKGRPTLLLSIFRNITNRKKAVAELIAAKENAELSNRLKDAFIANISHEIRTPLNGILGMNSLIKDYLSGYISGEVEEYFNGVENSSRRLIRTIDLILNFSMMQIGDYKMDLNLSTWN